MNLQYRADIDGLRAIAVLAVLLFHTEVPGFSGGFVGVDIFFVISGFLITSIILKEINAGTFSIANFYERRIRRIFPALFPVILFSLAVGAYLFDYKAFKDLGQSITATTLFSSNILFWRESGYFAAPSLQKPLLHTWSLAVEEQFYIFFPLALLAINRFLKQKYFAWVIVAFILSFAASVYGVYKAPGATFYLVPTRAWELMVGSILALGVLPSPSSPVTRNTLSIAGMSLIIYSIIFYTEATLFPGHNALAPVIGSGLIIYSVRGGGTSLVTKLLSVRPMVFIGLISYSLYLWHWPLIVFSKYLMFREFTWIDSSLIILASFIFAIASWKFIEQPFRGKTPLLPSRKKLFAYASATMIIAAGIGGMIHVQDGMWWRYPDTKVIVKQYNWDWKDKKVYGTLEQNPANVRPGILGSSEVKPSFIVWGDSHAMAILPAIDIAAKKSSIAGYVTTHSNAPAIQGIQHLNERHSYFDLKLLNKNVLNFIQSHPEINVVLLAARWSSYFGGKATVSGDIHLGLIETVQTLTELGKVVVLVCDYPTLENYGSPRAFYLSKRFPWLYPNPVALINIPTQQTHQTLNLNTCNFFDKLSGKYGVAVLKQDKPFFNGSSQLIVAMNGVPLYRDASHLSTFGSKQLAPLYEEFFEKRMNKITVGPDHGE